MSRRPVSQAHSIVGERIGRYVIEREIARGGMGVVYEARHETIGHRAALKVISSDLANDPDYPKYAGRVIDEARAVNVIDDPGVVEVFDLGTLPDGTVYIMMEYLEGHSLYKRQTDYLARTGERLPVPMVLRFTRQIASALAAAHEKRIIHRDLKPENVIVVSDREVPGEERTKVVDFGIARFLDAAQRRTADGVVLGTAIYISPEQCHGATELDGRVDVYALGIMLYEMLSGKPPFEGDATKMMLAHMSQPPPPLRKLLPLLPKNVCELVEDMLVKDPLKRLTMKDVVTRVKKIEGTTQDLLAPVYAQTLHQGDGVTLAARAQRWVPRQAMLAGAVGIALGLALVLGWTELWSGRGKNQAGTMPVTPQKGATPPPTAAPPPVLPVLPPPPSSKQPDPVALPPDGEHRHHHRHHSQ